MLRSVDIAIIGGGVIGCSIAYELSKKDVKCIVFEKTRLASGASGATAGMIGPIWYMDHTIDPYFQLGMKSWNSFPNLIEELKESGIDPEFQQNGAIKVFFDESRDGFLLDDLKWQEKLGLGVRWIDRKELIEREPQISDKALGGIFSPKDATIKGSAFVRALAHSAGNLGATILEGIDVISLKTERNKVVGVITQSGYFHAEHTIIAAGAWSGISRHWTPDLVPIRPIKGQRILIRKSGFVPKSWIQSLVPQKDGTILSAATREEGVFNNTVTGDAISQMVANAKEIFPILGDAEFISASAGVRPGTPDGMPILGSLPGLTGVSIASGHDHVGIMSSPATAKLMAEYVTTEDESPLKFFNLDRFAEDI